MCCIVCDRVATILLHLVVCLQHFTMVLHNCVTCVLPVLFIVCYMLSPVVTVLRYNVG